MSVESEKQIATRIEKKDHAQVTHLIAGNRVTHCNEIIIIHNVQKTKSGEANVDQIFHTLIFRVEFCFACKTKRDAFNFVFKQKIHIFVLYQFI